MSTPPTTVLVVEDDLSTQGLLVAVIKHLGLEAKAAGDGYAALSMIAADAPAAIVLDLIMPGMDGFAVLRRLRSSAPDLLARTIVVTAASIRDIDELPEMQKVWKFFRKPLDIEQLGMAVLACVGGGQRISRDGAYQTPPRP